MMISQPDAAGKCPVCSVGDVTLFIQLQQVPVHCNLLWSTREEALGAPRGDIRLGFCGDCHHVFNLAFEPDLVAYSGDYDNSLHYSPRFQGYATSLADRLIERHDLHGKDILEIGCGQGEFLRMICETGDNRGIGFDPSYQAKPTDSEALEQVRFVRDVFSERYADNEADLVCCRHVLEHIPDPLAFLRMVRETVGPRRDTVIFFETPNAGHTLRQMAIWDIIYEHCSYFGERSLRRLFNVCGFTVCSISEAFEGQFLIIEATPLAQPECPVHDGNDSSLEMAQLVSTFADGFRERVETARHRLEQIARTGQRMVAWGAGSKGVTLLNTLDVRDQVPYIVDINPRKQGKYVPGTGQPIVTPSFLRDVRPDIVIITNPVYTSEIRASMEELDLEVELVVM